MELTLDRQNATPTTPEVRRHAAFQLWLLNLLFAAVIGANYLWHVPQVEDLRMWFFALPALVSTALVLTIVPGALFWFAARFLASPRALGLLQACFWTVFQVLLFADTRIFNMFRYHMNGQVWNLIYVRGSEDAIHLGWQVWTSISVGLGAVVAFQLWFWRRSIARVQRRAESESRSIFSRPWLAAAAVLLPIVFLEKTLYASADLRRDRQMTHLARLFPLYARVPMEDLANTMLGVESERPPTVELESVTLDYPHARPAVRPDGPRPNVVVIVIDCLRADRLHPDHAPNLSAFAEESRVFEDHVSGGNSTRYGLFSLLYGLHGSYWFPVLNEQRGPVLVDTLKEEGYRFGIFGSASMDYPEMNDTLWTEVRDSVHDDFGDAESWRRDELAAEGLIDWFAENEDQPRFGFLLLDSPHQTYSYPPGNEPFQPAAPELDYMSMTRNEGPDPVLLEAVRNRYDNAVYHADDVAGRVLDALRASPAFENTLVVVTGDHGEEFLESGFFGHTSAFTEFQVRVPLILAGPGIEPGIETRPTSHLDFAPTIVEMLGASSAGRASWCLGENLLDPPAERRRVFSGWNELGIWTPEAVLRVPLSPFEFSVEVYDYDWQLVHEDTELLVEETETLEVLGAECNRFLR